jgi:hypothetical protein
VPIDPAREYPFGIRPQTPLWSENFALVFADPQQRISALYSIGTWYLDTSVWRENLALVLPDGQILVGRNFGRNTQAAVVSASVSRYEIVAADRRVRLTWNGPASANSFEQLLQHGGRSDQLRRLQLSLDFVATAPTWDMHAGHDRDRTGLAGALHIEQIGVCNGTLRVDDKEYRIAQAYTCRDHSRGARDITQYRNHCWINGSFPGGRSFQLYNFRMHHIEGAALSLATVTQDGQHHTATIEHVEYVNALGDARALHRIVLRCALGEMSIAVQEVLTSIPMTMTSPFNPAAGLQPGPHGQMFDEGIRLEWNGVTGYGWSERGFSQLPIR